MEPPAPADIGKLIQDLKAPDAAARRAAAERLGQSTLVEIRVLTALNEAVTGDDDQLVQRAAADAYRTLTQRQKEAAAGSPPATTPSVGPHTYTDTASRYMGYGLAAVTAVAGLFVLLRGSVPLVGLLLWGVAAWLAYGMSALSLTLSESGLEYHNSLTTITASWDQVVVIVQLRGRYGPYECLVLANGGQTIPLSEFGGQDWRDGDLGEDLKRWAPRLLKSDLTSA